MRADLLLPGLLLLAALSQALWLVMLDGSAWMTPAACSATHTPTTPIDGSSNE